MKEHHHQKRTSISAALAAIYSSKLTKATALFLLLFLTYALGFLFSSSSPPQPVSQPITRRNRATSAPPNPLDEFKITTQCSPPLPSNLVRQTILDKVYNGTSPYANFPPAHVSNLLRPKRIKGWGSTGAVFGNLISRSKPKTIIEVGTFLGASAIHMAQKAQAHGLKAQILCLDDFRGWPGFQDRFKDIKMINGDVLLLYQFMQNVVYMNQTESILAVPFSTGSGLEKLCEWGIMADLIEIDAGHDFNSAWADINRAYKILRPGGVLFGHDYFTAADNRGVRRAVNLFAHINGLKVKVDGQHWVIDLA
ncbi:hypothetical protein RJ641_016624 [Dillenia turbinata]|uniref:S-adenosyl-L-methionine-dependent methyltransferase n=1 Tax=Dillenia turbinata TaxID=194707 RepID=A0AAN8UWP4_9MAGN